MTPYARSTRYTMRHALRLWAWGICTEFEICRTGAPEGVTAGAGNY